MPVAPVVAGGVEWAVFFLGAAIPVYIVFGLIRLSGFREITRYEKNDTLYYTLNPVTKILALFMVAVASPMAGIYFGLLATALILASYSTLSKGREKLRIGGLFTVAVVWGTVWTPLSDRLSFFISGRPSGFLSFYGELTRFVATQVAVSGVFLLALILVMTSTPSAVMRALKQLGMPNAISFSIVVGMKTVPALLEAINSTIKIQFMRGFGGRGSRPLGPLYTMAAAILALIPSLVMLLRGARNTAISTGTRAFGAYKTRTNLAKPPFGAADVAVLSLAALFLGAAIFA